MRRLVTLALFASLAGCILDLSDDDDDGGGSGATCGGFVGAPCASDEYCDYADGECGIADGAGTCQERPIACPDVYMPVYGADGEIYGNACDAHANGVDDCGPAPQR